MKYRFFSIPVQDARVAEEELNRFLSAHRVVSVDKEFAADGRHSLWCFCVSYLDDDAQAVSQRRSKVDYREVLDEPDFAIYAKLRALRKQLAERDAVPAYTLFTNEQLADMVRKRVTTVSDLERISGIGKARIEKYGADFLALLREALAPSEAGEIGAAELQQAYAAVHAIAVHADSRGWRSQNLARFPAVDV